MDALANGPLRGLYWLAKDILEDEFRAVMEPDAEALYELRNHLEHKFVAVHDGVLWPDMMFIGETASIDGLFHISIQDLADRTLRMLKLGRAALIYLSLGLTAEDWRRREDAPKGKVSLSAPLFTVRDDAKRHN